MAILDFHCYRIYFNIGIVTDVLIIGIDAIFSAELN